jgi:hypothetical protein
MRRSSNDDYFHIYHLRAVGSGANER